jgi:hypothetical protein
MVCCCDRLQTIPSILQSNDQCVVLDQIRESALQVQQTIYGEGINSYHLQNVHSLQSLYSLLLVYAHISSNPSSHTI